MGHIQRKCGLRGCRRTIPPGARRCPGCGGTRSAWVARVQGPDGRERSRTFANRADAERFIASTEVSRARGEWVDPALGRVTLKDWIAQWLATVRPTLKPKTARGYESLIDSRIVPALGRYPIADISLSDVQGWVNAMQAEGLSASRIREAHVVLSQSLQAAVRDGRLGRNPARGIKMPPLRRREAEYFEPEVVERIAAAIPPPYGLLVHLMGTLGPRYGEAVALRRRAVNLVTRRLIIEESMAEVSGKVVFGTTKTHAIRKLPLTPSLAKAFDRHLREHVGPEPDALVFTSPRGAPLRHRNFIQRFWKPTLDRLGLPAVGLHVLRHSAAAALIRSGASPKAVQQILGHQSAAFTLTVYGHIFDMDLDVVAQQLEESLTSRRPRRDTDGTHLRVVPGGERENGR